MTIFIKVTEIDPAQQLLRAVRAARMNVKDEALFEADPQTFKAIPLSPFAYWVSDDLRLKFKQLPAFESEKRTAKLGASTKNNFRFLRLNWEILSPISRGCRWVHMAKGGAFARFYSDIHLCVNWQNNAREIEAELLQKFPYLGENADFVLHRGHPFFRPGLTWSQRTQKGLSVRVLPKDCIFTDKGPAAVISSDDCNALLALIALTNSAAFAKLVSMQMSFGSYEVGVIQRTPVPQLRADEEDRLAALARYGWSLKRKIDTIEETSHSFVLPALLRTRLGDYDTQVIEAETMRILVEIDAIAFDQYGFSEADRAAALFNQSLANDADVEGGADDEGDDEDTAAPVGQVVGLLSWSVGVAFGRFDWRLATGEREISPEPDPFDPLPAKSPGMLPDGALPFHSHTGILVDDQGHPHDLSRLMEEVLVRVQADVPSEMRRWLQRDFFPLHLKQYSKSRRKAPIYWPLSTNSGSYTLWLYYPSLTSQTLYTAVNDFIEPKLKHVGQDVATLRTKGSARSREDEKSFEALQALELELIELRDTLLAIAQTYRPSHDDGVQITAAPLWQLFRHAPWQKLLKETWAKLEKGDYDWAHLALAYWPERVREKCKTDKSLAIAHNLEGLYVEPDAQPKKSRGKKKAGGDQ
jgi:hypothetical protein